jgi:DNA-binding XRE family transcriptional regulator
MLDWNIPIWHKNAMNALKKHLRDEKIKQADFAADLDVKQGTVSKIASGVIVPSLPLALKIERITRGAVPVSSWASEAEAS